MTARGGSGDRPRLAITLGDPRGIGPEIVRAALGDDAIARLAEFTIVGPDEEAGADPARAGAAAGQAIERAVRLAIGGEVDGIVTAPIDKAALLAGGYGYPGHTEMLAALTGSDVAMIRPRENPPPHRSSCAACPRRPRAGSCAAAVLPP